eukprot:347190-Chlamydomonas_euryale.AAC.1
MPAGATAHSRRDVSSPPPDNAHFLYTARQQTGRESSRLLRQDRSEMQRRFAERGGDRWATRAVSITAKLSTRRQTLASTNVRHGWRCARLCSPRKGQRQWACEPVLSRTVRTPPSRRPFWGGVR